MPASLKFLLLETVLDQVLLIFFSLVYRYTARRFTLSLPRRVAAGFLDSDASLILSPYQATPLCYRGIIVLGL